MSYENLTKGLIMVSVVYMITSFFAFNYETDSRQALQEINSMSNDLNSADKPAEAFQILEDNANDSKLSGPQIEALGHKVEGETFSHRIKVAGKALYDISYTQRLFLENIESSEENLSQEGLYLENCPNSFSYGELCDSIRPGRFLNYFADWMTLAQETGSVKNIRQNRSAWNEIRQYLKRAEYYDKRLSDFQIRPIQIAYYTNKSLYIVGRGEEKISVGDKTLKLEGQDPLTYTDVELDNGTHILKRGNHRILLEIGPEVPDYGITSEGKLAVDNRTGPYTSVKIQGDETLTKKLNKNKTTVIRIPEENTPISETQYQPFQATFISNIFNQTITMGEPHPGVNQDKAYAYGMEPEEYRITQELLKNTDVRQETTFY
ncbi:hypothetical protein AQV86_00160 [Nanohaloarchaea archaeon SG9]|nr:hypothetical protein AQV86_00160 [Nanohaloarchaea archaeon SG9]